MGASDPFLIANAMETGRVIVTNERRRGANVADRNNSIVNVAEGFNVECLNLNGLARREGWRF